MTRHEELVEAYEDAYFALLMEAVAEMEGAKWEERRKELENDPSAVVPESVDRKCIRTIERCFARQRRQKTLRKTGKVLNCAAILVAIVSVLFTSVLAVSEDARVAAANLLVTVSDRYTEMQFNPGEKEDEPDNVPVGESLDGEYFSRIHIGWLPEGFSYIDGIPDMIASFENNDGLLISIEYVDSYVTYQFDTEDTEKEEPIEINGHSVIKVLKDDDLNMVLINKEQNCFVNLLASQDISTDIAIEILKNISFA